MLLAELHGKRFPEAEGQEDWLTSAVFGNLRHIQPSVFWRGLFLCARSVEDKGVSLTSELDAAGIRFENFTELTTMFWRTCSKYGEPDLILRFTGPTVRPLIVLVEVKLNSSKSGVGENDQLARYLALLDDPAALPDWQSQEDRRYLIYLTRARSQPRNWKRASQRQPRRTPRGGCSGWNGGTFWKLPGMRAANSLCFGR